MTRRDRAGKRGVEEVKQEMDERRKVDEAEEGKGEKRGEEIERRRMRVIR